jgi:hypothetical protein
MTSDRSDQTLSVSTEKAKREFRPKTCPDVTCPFFIFVFNLLIFSQIEDIVSMLNEEKSTKESELHGRQSGSLAWKLSRRETDQQVSYLV